MSKIEACPLEEYINGNGDLAVSRNSSWESTFFASLGQEPEEASEDEQGSRIDEDPPMKINSYKEANKLL